MTIDVSELMTDPDFAQTITLRRPKGTAFANEGVATVSYEPDRKMSAVVQPARPSDAQLLPEGVNLSDVVSIWSRTDLRISGNDGAISDVLVVRGRSYRVIQREDRIKNGYTRVLAQRFEL